MSDSDTIEFSGKGLDKLIKAFQNVPEIHVGILADHNSRNGVGSNAEIGAKHEFGMDGLPVRSFLRMPLTQNLNSYLEKSGAFDKDALNEVIKSGSLDVWATKIGIIAESIILDAFDTGGFGQWRPSNMRYKKNKQTLVETQQLRNSISSEVIE